MSDEDQKGKGSGEYSSLDRTLLDFVIPEERETSVACPACSACSDNCPTRAICAVCKGTHFVPPALRREYIHAFQKDSKT